MKTACILLGIFKYSFLLKFYRLVRFNWICCRMVMWVTKWIKEKEKLYLKFYVFKFLVGLNLFTHMLLNYLVVHVYFMFNLRLWIFSIFILKEIIFIVPYLKQTKVSLGDTSMFIKIWGVTKTASHLVQMYKQTSYKPDSIFSYYRVFLLLKALSHMPPNMTQSQQRVFPWVGG